MGIFLTGMCFVHFSFDLIAQERFSKTSDFADQLVFNDVYITDSGYVTTSRAIDSDFSNPYFVTRFDQQGEQISQVIYDSQGWYLEGIFDTDVQLNDSTWLIACERRNDLSDTTYCALLWMNEMGGTLFSRQFMSPYFNPEYDNTAWVRPTAINKSEDGNSIFIVCRIVDYPPVQNGFIIQQYSSDGVKGWTYESPIDNNYFACDDIVERNDTIYAIKYGATENFYPKIISIDDLTGTLNWQNQLDGDTFPYSGTKSIVLSSNGIVCASLKAQENFASVPAIFK
ncbi:MAG: hypothetical protein ACKVOK_16135, partial [Flavobacteriales bacterium]